MQSRSESRIKKAMDNDNSVNVIGFRPSINQLLVIIHSDDETPRALFLDISKAFIRGWHDGLILMLKSTSISEKLLDFLKSYIIGWF